MDDFDRLCLWVGRAVVVWGSVWAAARLFALGASRVGLSAFVPGAALFGFLIVFVALTLWYYSRYPFEGDAATTSQRRADR